MHNAFSIISTPRVRALVRFEVPSKKPLNNYTKKPATQATLVAASISPAKCRQRAVIQLVRARVCAYMCMCVQHACNACMRVLAEESISKVVGLARKLAACACVGYIEKTRRAPRALRRSSSRSAAGRGRTCPCSCSCRPECMGIRAFICLNGREAHTAPS